MPPIPSPADWSGQRPHDRGAAANAVAKARGDTASTADALLEPDIAFHASIAAGAGNVVLASVFDTFSARTYRARHLNAGLGLEEALVRSRASRRRICEAVAARDPEAARASASAHVANLTGWLRSVLT